MRGPQRGKPVSPPGAQSEDGAGVPATLKYPFALAPERNRLNRHRLFSPRRSPHLPLFSRHRAAPTAVARSSSPSGRRRRPMEQFHDGHHVRLRSRVRGTYLHADKDGAGVSLGRRRSSPRVAWAVHLHQGNDGTQYLLLHSAAYGRYLAATDAPAPLPLCGSRVVQRDYDQPQPHPQAVAIRWQAAPSGSGNDVLLRHVGTHYRYLRANGKYLRWVNGVTVDEGGVNLTTMMHWVVEPIPPRLGMPALPPPIRERQPEDLSVVVLGLAAAPQHLIRYVRASADGFYPEDPVEGWYVHQFSGRSVNLLWHALAIELCVPNIIMCVRAGRYGRPTPLVVNLPRDGHGHTFDIVVIVDGTPASTELRHPDVDA